MGVGSSYICDLESGRRFGVRLGTLSSVAKALGVEPAVLISPIPAKSENQS